MQKRRPEDEPAYIVGMDGHSRKLAISVWDWSDRWNPVTAKEIRCFDISALEATYRRHVDPDSLTVIESSSNSMALKRRLDGLGFRAEIVRADTIADKERKCKVCGLQDARNLARAYIKGDIDELVWAPSDRYSEYRDIMFAYRDTHWTLLQCQFKSPPYGHSWRSIVCASNRRQDELHKEYC